MFWYIPSFDRLWVAWSLHVSPVHLWTYKTSVSLDTFSTHLVLVGAIDTQRVLGDPCCFCAEQRCFFTLYFKITLQEANAVVGSLSKWLGLRHTGETLTFDESLRYGRSLHLTFDETLDRGMGAACFFTAC